MKMLKSNRIVTKSFEAIDPNTGIIKGVLVCSEGEAKGHGIHLNADFIKAVATFGQAEERGVKARFGHPNMCSDALGTYLGVFTNFRTVEKDARLHAVADMQLSDTAKLSPNGNLYDYILSLAANEPDKFGTSIVFTPGESFTVEGDEREFATIESLFAADFVDEPAATEGLFDTSSLASKVTEFLDGNPAAIVYLKNKPEVIEMFLQRYNLNKKESIHKSNLNMKNKFILLMALLTIENLESTAEGCFLNEEQLGTIEDKLKMFDAKDDKIAEQEAKIAELEAKLAELEGKKGGSEDNKDIVVIPELAAKDAEIKNLTAKIKELEAITVVESVEKNKVEYVNSKLSDRTKNFLNKNK